MSNFRNPTINIVGGGSIEPYDSTRPYSVGELFIYNNRYGITLTAHAAEAFNSAHNALTAMQADIVGIETAIEEIEQTLSAHGTSISALQTAVSNNSALITSIQSDIANINGDIVDLQADVENHEERVGELEEVVLQHTSDIANIEDVIPATATTDNPLATMADISTGVSKYEITTVGDNGTFTDAQFTLLMDNSKNVVIVNAGERYYLADEVTGSYRTYINVNMPSETVLSRKEISVNIASEAVNYKHWSKEVGVITDNVLVVESDDYVTLSDSNSTAVPVLTTQQVTDIYNAVGDDKYVYVRDTVGTNQLLVQQRAPYDSNTTIYCSYLGRLLLAYSVVNSQVVITFKEVFDKSYLDRTYAPLSYFSNMYGALNTGNIINLVDSAPSASPNNILQLSNSTNTSYDWNNPSVVFVRQVKVDTTLTNTNSMTLQLKYKTSRNTTISWGARIEHSTNNINWTAISSNQSFNAVTVEADNGTTTDLAIFTDTISGSLTAQKNSYLRILLFKKQDTATALTTNLYFGVTVDNAYVGTTARFNFTNVSINTNLILDGSVTKPKLSTELQAEINGKQNQLDTVQMQAVNSGITSSGWQQALADITTATNDIDTLQSDLVAAQQMISQQGTVINTLQAAVNNAEQDITDLQVRTSFLENDVESIKPVIPEQASGSNKLATQYEVAEATGNILKWYNELPTATDKTPDFAGVLNDGMYYKEVILHENMADNTWGAIAYAFKHGIAPSTWTVGSTKNVTMKNGDTYTVRLIEINEAPNIRLGRFKYTNKYGTARAIFEFVQCVKTDSATTFQMNHTAVNNAGFKQSAMLIEHLQDIEELLPDTLYENIATVDVNGGIGGGTTSGTNIAACKLFLPCEVEIFASNTYSIGVAEDISGRFEYYRLNTAASDKIKTLNGTAQTYWLRSTKSSSSTDFCIVTQSGTVGYDTASYTLGIAPIFAI